MVTKTAATQVMEIEVQMYGEGPIAKICSGKDGKPATKALKGKERYMEELRKLLAKLSKEKLPIMESVKETDQEPREILDAVRFCSPGEEGYIFALAHELSHHPIGGKMIRGIVQPVER